MSELFVELFSEEIPARLQINARNELKKNIKNFFIDNQIKFNENFNVYSTPNRLVLHVDKIPNEIKLSSEEIKGPNVNAPEKALEGFIRSNNTKLEKIFMEHGKACMQHHQKFLLQKLDKTPIKINAQFCTHKILFGGVGLQLFLPRYLYSPPHIYFEK